VLLFTVVYYNCRKSGIVEMAVKRRMMVKEPRKQSFWESVIIVDYVVTQAKIAGRKKRTGIRDQQDGKRSQKGDLSSMIPRKKELNMDGHPEINSKLDRRYRCNGSLNSTLSVVNWK
jgi:hypothetical protein